MYRQEYRHKLTTPDQAVAPIRHAATIIHGMASGEPPALLAAIAQRVRQGDLRDLKVYSLLPMANAAATILSPDLAGLIHPHCWFLSGADRDQVRAGTHIFVPNQFHQIPRLIRDFMEVDVTVTTVSPMDRAGFFSFGTVNDYISTAARHCRRLIVEVNRHMPRVFGDALLHVSEVDAIVEYDAPLVELIPAGAQARSRNHREAHCRHGAGRGHDPAGPGRHPQRRLPLSGGAQGPGNSHGTALPGDGAPDQTGGDQWPQEKPPSPEARLYQRLRRPGVVRIHQRQPQHGELPRLLHQQPQVIAANDNMISINSTIEVDLLGQCNSEFLGGFEFSGTGGQLDFVRGAFNSKGGKSIIAFYSTAHHGEVSRVVPRFAAGTVTTTPRMDTHYLVTEYGAVNLMGKSTCERALEIVKLAHPKFRDSLMDEARKMCLA